MVRRKEITEIAEHVSYYLGDRLVPTLTVPHRGEAAGSALEMSPKCQRLNVSVFWDVPAHRHYPLRSSSQERRPNPFYFISRYEIWLSGSLL